MLQKLAGLPNHSCEPSDQICAACLGLLYRLSGANSFPGQLTVTAPGDTPTEKRHAWELFVVGIYILRSRLLTQPGRSFLRSVLIQPLNLTGDIPWIQRRTMIFGSDAAWEGG